MSPSSNATDDTNSGIQDCCPRCGGSFHCGAADATPCPCTTLKLDTSLLAELNRRYDRCLCLRCLRELAAASQAPQATPVP